MSTVTPIHRVSVIDRALSDPMCGFHDQRDFLGAVMAAGRNPLRVDGRLRRLQATQGSDEQGAYSDPHGGFLIPKLLAPTTLAIGTEDPTGSLTTPIEMGSPIVGVNARNDESHADSVSGGLQMIRRPETTTVSASRFKLAQCSLHSPELVGYSYASNELVSDSPQSLSSVLSVFYAHERNATILREKISGSGVGEYHGILKAGCLIAVDKESSQTAGTIVAENLEEMESRCWHYHRAIWLAHPDHKKGLKRLKRTIGTGGSALPYYTYSSDGQAMLSGRPIFFSDRCEATGSVGDIVCGVWSEYIEGIYLPLQMASSIHVRFVENESAFRFMERGDGMAWWRVPLTQRNSAITVSPFVALAARE